MFTKQRSNLKFISLLVIGLFPVAALSQSASTNQTQIAERSISTVEPNLTGINHSQNDGGNIATEESWRRLIDEATDLYYTEPDKSLVVYESAKTLAVRLNDKRLLALTLYYIGNTYSGTGNLEKAIITYLDSKKAFDEAGIKTDVVYVLSDIGSLYLYSGDYPKAKQYAKQSVALEKELETSEKQIAGVPEKRGVASALLSLGNISKAEGDFTRAIDHLEKSLVIYKELEAGGSNSKRDISDCLADIGRVHRVMGDNLKALSYLNHALTVAEKADEKTSAAGVANSIGILYLEQGDFPKAEDFLNRSLEIYVAEKDDLEVAKVKANLGVLYQKRGNPRQALSSFSEALKAAEASQHREIEILALEGIGSVLADQGNHAEALENYDKGLRIAEEVNDGTRRAELLWRKAEVHSAVGELQPSIVLASKAATLAGQLGLPVISYLALTTKGTAQLAKGEYESARETLTGAINHVEEMRGQVVGREQERQLFFEKRTDAYYALVELFVAQGKFEEALAYAERAKGRVLLDMLRGDKIKEVALTPDEQAEAQRLNARLVAINMQLKSASGKRRPDAQEIATLEKRLQKARLDQEEFESNLSATHPELRWQRGEHTPFAANEASSLVPDSQTALLEFVVSREKVYLFVLTKESAGQAGRIVIRAYPLSISNAKLARLTENFRNSVAELDDFREQARRVYDSLLKPAEEQLNGKHEICIVPDGVLWELPFQALLTPRNKFLLEERAVFYASSLSVLREIVRMQQQQDKKTSSARLLALGNPFVAGERSKSLPEAETEVKALTAIYGKARSKILIGKEAREDIAKTDAAKFDILHFAAHGILDDNNPLYSHLDLASDGTNEDGLLEAREIMRLNLTADLAVLSACETARGKVRGGEGMIGMAWAFAAAGVPTTIVSGWKIDSASAAALMVDFHKSLANGQRKSKAASLREAALKLMHEPKYKHPFYWASFVLVGSSR